jgi:isoquinoline 1-oxidoreductase beta subunit
MAVNPNLIAQQMEGAVVFGLSAALHGRIDIVDGRIVPGDFRSQPPLGLADTPVIETHIVPSDAPPQGVGEPGVPPIAPAVANAWFALTGRRVRQLPITGSA